MSLSKLFIRALLLTLCSVVAVFGQIKSATITGTVKDASGAIVPGARVTIMNEETTVLTEGVSNESGEFTVPYLAAGRYAVEVAVTGFSSYKQAGIALTTNQTLRVDVVLQTGSVSAVVEVTATTALQTDTTQVQNGLNSNIIESAPNPTGNVLAFAALQPGVIARDAVQDTQSVEAMGIGIDARRAFSAISINGGQAFGNDVQLDGLSVQGSAWNEAAVLPNQDGIQEVRTQINNFTAEYGRGMGVIQMTTKSGGNQYHGSLNYRLRNEAFNANSYQRNALSLPRLPFKSHNYSGTFGGPIWIPKVYNGKNKAFFFVSYDGLFHNRGIEFLRTVPTAKERIGDFSDTYELVNGTPVKVRLWDPFVAALVPGQTNQYQRAEIPNADLSKYVRADGSRGVDPYALKLLSYYPLPNREPDGVGVAKLTNTNNYLREDIQTYRKGNWNARLDYKAGQHSFYSTLGLTRGEIITPRTWGGDNPFYGQNSFIGNQNNDNNPYVAVGDTYVLNASTVIDVRYGINRINTNNRADTFDDFDYGSFGIPANLLPLNGALGAPIEFQVGERYSALNASNSLHKQERQTNHSFNASLTKSLASWTLKFGGEARVYLSNYIDPEESFWIQTSQDYTRGIVTASGGGAGPAVDASNDGLALASFLLGAGTISVAEGRSVALALAQKYAAVYTQNDWRVNQRLTLNLGLRWDLQPGPTERYDRLSAVDFERLNPFGTKGLIVFPGVNGRRNLYQTRYKEFAPRTGFAYRLREDFIVRGGYGITYLPANTGYYDGTYNYGSATFSLFTNPQAYGLTPQGKPVGRYYEVNLIAGGENAKVDAASAYGGGTPRFDYRDYRSGAVQQANLFLQKRFGRNWTASIGYSGSRGDHLQVTNVAANQAQLVDPALLTAWRNEYLVTRNNPASVQITNPYQPDARNLIAFKGNLGRTTLSRLEAAYPYPHLGTLGVKRAFGYSDYHALMLQVDRRLSQGLYLNAHYTWSKSLELQQSDAQSNQGYNQTGDAPNLDFSDLSRSRRLSLSDTPHRFVVNFTYDLPFSNKGWIKTGDGLLNSVVGGWRLAGNFQASSGVPLHIIGVNTNALNGRGDRVNGVPVELPKDLQRWYDGNTLITLPSGRQYRPPANTFLKYNPDAFTGRVIQYTSATGAPAWISDLYYYGTAAQTYSDIRTDSRWNLNLSVQKTFSLYENVKLDLAAQASNAFNHTQWRPSGYGRNLGGQATSTTNGQIPGYATNAAFGTHSLATMEPRSILMQLKLRF